MKIVVAGIDQSAAWGPALAREAERMKQNPRILFLPPCRNALSLREAADESDFLRRYLDLVRYKNHVDTRIFDIPHKPGPVGRIAAALRGLLWKVLRYQHDRVTFRQNLINSQLESALEFQAVELQRLRERLDQVERARRVAGDTGPAS